MSPDHDAVPTRVRLRRLLWAVGTAFAVGAAKVAGSAITLVLVQAVVEALH